jgi:hypothetical protein
MNSILYLITECEWRGSHSIELPAEVAQSVLEFSFSTVTLFHGGADPQDASLVLKCVYILAKLVKSPKTHNKGNSSDSTTH